MNAKEEWEVILLGKEEARKRRKIRGRVSYRDWVKIHQDLKICKTMPMLMHIVYGILDQRRAYGYRTRSRYAHESLELFLEDLANAKV